MRSKWRRKERTRGPSSEETDQRVGFEQKLGDILLISAIHLLELEKEMNIGWARVRTLKIDVLNFRNCGDTKKYRETNAKTDGKPELLKCVVSF